MPGSHVHVAVRVKPSSEASDFICVVDDPPTLILKRGGQAGGRRTTSDLNAGLYQFHLTAVMERASNEAVYGKAAAQVVQSVMDGYNGTIMAYGQTGSGALPGRELAVARRVQLPPHPRTPARQSAGAEGRGSARE